MSCAVPGRSGWRASAPFWERTWIDVILLVIAGLVYWRTAASGYQIVLAPEGVAQTSVSYEAFLAPIVAASASRQARLVTRGVVLVTLAFSFAVSTAVFNTTYNSKSTIDAALTNGADVTVTGTSAYPAGPLLDRISHVAGVRAARAMMHRFAYVGSDLQDIYGIDPLRIGDATDLSNAFFANNDAPAAMRLLASRADGVLLSQETVNDFQLHIGDLITLRVQYASDHQYHAVPFHFLGVVREFSTAPKDSFILCNAGYLAAQTGDSAREVERRPSHSRPALEARPLSAARFSLRLPEAYNLANMSKVANL